MSIPSTQDVLTEIRKSINLSHRPLKSGVRTQSAIDCRKRLVERFGMDLNASFVEVAKRLIEADHLLVEADVSTREGACAFLTCYKQRSDFAAVRPLPRTGR